MTEEKLVTLMTKIDEKTTGGALKWEKTAVDDEFQTTLASFVIRVNRNTTNDDRATYVISLMDKNGTQLETISNYALAVMLSSVGMGYLMSNPHTVMERIFTNARRQALGVDKAIDDILSELN